MRPLTHEALTALSLVLEDVRKMSDRVQGSIGVLMDVSLDETSEEAVIVNVQFAIDRTLSVRRPQGNAPAQADVPPSTSEQELKLRQQHNTIGPQLQAHLDRALA